MFKFEKQLLKEFNKAEVVGVLHTEKLDKVLLKLPSVPEVTIECWVGGRVTFSAVLKTGEPVRIHPKPGVRYDNLETWLRETATQFL